jgi:hypothetical protein
VEIGSPHTSKRNVNVLEACVVLSRDGHSALNSIHGGVTHDKLGLIAVVFVETYVDGGLAKLRDVAGLVTYLAAQSLHSVMIDD